jgi:hypothetical protein
VRYVNDEPREALESALTRWAKQRTRSDSDRDALVLAAVRHGIGKTRIHELTGIARTTIDRILKGES